ncbi:MAG: hypothetical protein AB7S26_27745 [Sandaracinaceae bacterium]
MRTTGELAACLAAVTMMLGCGGSEAGTAEPSSVADQEGTGAGNAPSDEEPGADLIAPPPTEAMVQQMLLQAAIDDAAVRAYLHLEQPSNLPLALFAAPDLAEGAPSVTAGDRPVRVTSEGEARVRFTARESVEGAVRLQLAIPGEGVSGYVDLRLVDYEWRVVDRHLVET